MLNRLAIFGAALAMLIASQVDAAPLDAQSVRSFVQSFYTWYASGVHDVSPLEVVLAKRPSVLSPELFRALKADDDAQRKVPDDIVGLDFDPFLNSQEQAGRYTVGAITMSDGIYRVEVRDLHSKQPAVIAQVASGDGKPVFVNFLYPGNGDLLRILKTLARERAQPSSQAR